MKHSIGNGALGALILTMAAQAATGAPAGDVAQLMPPPGLYRIDSEGQFGWQQAPGITVQQKVDGASGTTVDRRSAGGAVSERVYQGSGAVTHCVKFSNKQAVALPAALGGACKLQSTSVGKDSVVHQASCPDGQTSVTVKRIDADTWEYQTSLQVNGSAAPSLAAAVKPVLEHKAVHGATQAERDQAAQQLKALPAMQAQMTAERGAAAEVLAKALKAAKSPQEAAGIKAALASLQGTLPMHAEQRERWTRIGNVCAL